MDKNYMVATSTAIGDNSPLLNLPRHRKKRPGRYVSALIAGCFLIWILIAFAQGNIEWDVTWTFMFSPRIVEGVLNTLLMAPIAMALAIAIGLVMAMMRMSENPVSRSIAIFYMWVFRGSPQLLQLYLWFNLALVFPAVSFFGFWQVPMIEVMTPFTAALLGLAICQSAYTAEVIRGGIISVDSGQFEAADALGISHLSTMRRIILPQALRSILPPIGNEFIGMVKATSLASAVQYFELMNAAQRVYFQNNYIIELLMVAAFWYLAIVSLLSIGQSYLEKWVSRGQTRRPVSIPDTATETAQ